ncbi:MAG: hypothetical protein JWM68_2439 [Verrucomicrobiales bacterium]|nr:hypothetical protein [Verrucomicrobiales bacterium]
MDTSFYFVRCKGEEKGPYAFYQIQQMRTEEVFTRDKFLEDEWEQLEQFIDDGGDIPRPKNGQAAIRRKQDDAKRPAGRLVVGLTFLSYSIAGFFILAAMMQGDHDYILKSRPMFWLGLVFSAALCHTIVDRSCHRRLERYKRTSRFDLITKYFATLFLFALAIAAVVGFEKYVNSSSLNYLAVYRTGKIYFGAAALVALYKPFYIWFLREQGFLKQRRKSSIPWLSALLGFVVLLGLYMAPTAGLSHSLITSARESLFATESSGSADAESDWSFLVHLRDSEKAVQRILGKPTISGRDYVYGCLRVSFDQQHRVARLHFDGRDLSTSVFARKKILTGLTPVETFEKMKSVFGAKNVTFGDSMSETHVWELPEYRVAACFWIKDTPTAKANSVKWLEISATQ